MTVQPVEHLVVEEVQQQLRMKNAHTARRLMAAGDIASIKVGGRWLTTQADIDAYLDRLRQEREERRLPQNRRRRRRT
jgi:hypothetical protein